MNSHVPKHGTESLTPLIEIRDATVFRGSTRVFHHFSLNLEQGCNTVILGPNGAGKNDIAEDSDARTLPGCARRIECSDTRG